MKTTQSTKPAIPHIGLATFFLLAVLIGIQAQTTPCVDTNLVKFLLAPNTQGGLDVRDSRQGIVLADDFPCNTNGPITDIHIWGSWLSDQHGTVTNFWLGIYSDVPAVVNPAGPNTPSHPGALLWQQSFGLGQYAESIINPPGTEYFYNPTNNAIIGGDTQAWYYCFYPTNPFVQQGTAANPTNYWLAVRAQIGDQTTLFGWKTALVAYNDAAVWGTIDATGLPSGDWQPMMNPLGGQVDLSLKLETTAPCPLPVILVTNQVFACGAAWTSYAPPVYDPCCCPSNSICYYFLPYSAVTNGTPCSEVITYVWHYTDCQSRTVSATNTLTIVSTNPPIMACATNKSVINGAAWTFDAPTAVDACSGSNLTVTVLNTVTNGQGPCGETFTRTWQATDQCGNTANCSQTVTNVCLPVLCAESDFDKYVQWPNLNGGFDVWDVPYVLADDFVCTNPGPISDIHLWGSWLGDQAQPNSITFWLGIYNDVPVGPGNNYSHPGTNLLWQQWFAPGQYAETIWTRDAVEQFIDPGLTNILGPDHQVWYYCFYPTNAFQQLGTAAAPKTYWLAAYATNSPLIGIYGWKTTTNVLHDTSVHAFWPGGPPTGNPGWSPTVVQPAAGGPAVPLDLSFKLTMCSPVNIKFLTPTNVIVTWAGGGFLQSATNVAGPYVDVSGAPTSPYTDWSVSPTNKFYRLRCY